MKKRLYFGHPVNVYDTDLENQLLRRIAEAFPDWEIENPNQEKHQEGYSSWKKMTGNGMDYFFKKVLPDCHGGIFLPFRDGEWGAGVAGEADFIAGLGFPIWQIACTGEISQIDIAKIRSVSVEETRARTRTPSGGINPY